MKIISEKETPMVTLNCDISQEERDNLIFYAIKNMKVNTFHDLLVEWAFIDIIKKQVAEEEKQLTKKRKGK
jgi:hypothetical protein